MAGKDKLANLAVELSLQNEQFIKALNASTKKLDDISRGTKKSAKSLNVMEAGFKAIAVAAAAFYTATRAFGQAKGLVEAEEKIINLKASFTALLGSAEAGGDMLQRVFGIVEETGASFDSAATSVQRLAIGLTEIGATNDQIAKIAENFIKLGRVSGTAMADINGALIQFTQGLASGRLQGDELRSIFERLPQVIQLIAREMNITTGEVRQMGAEGKITADIMANALLGASKEINDSFQTLEFTVEQTLAVMESEWVKTAAIISQSLGFKDDFRGFFELLTDLAKATADFFIRQAVLFEYFKRDVLKLGKTLAEFFAWFTGEDIDLTKMKVIDDAIESQDKKAKDLAKTLKDLQKSMEGKGTGVDVELINNTTESLSAFETQLLNINDAFTSFEDKAYTLNKLFLEGAISVEVYEQEIKKLSKAYREFVSEDNDPMSQYKKSIEELEILFTQGIITLEQYTEAAGKAFEKLSKTQEKATDGMLENMQRLAADGVSDLVDVILEADKSFSDFAENFLKQIAKMIIQQQLLNAIKGTAVGDFFGFAKGGAFGSPTGLPQGVYNQPTFFPMPNSSGLTAFAQGGTFGTGVGVMGEAGAEAIVPLRRGMNGDLGVQSSPVNVVINNNTSDTADVYAESTIKQDGSKQIEIMVERKVKESLGNGALDKSFSTNYGLKRRAM